jgi:hypothetical protein
MYSISYQCHNVQYQLSVPQCAVSAISATMCSISYQCHNVQYESQHTVQDSSTVCTVLTATQCLHAVWPGCVMSGHGTAAMLKDTAIQIYVEVEVNRQFQAAAA